MVNPLIIEDPFWDRRRLVSGAAVVSVLAIAFLWADGYTLLTLVVGATAPVACLWAPYAVATFPLAGWMFAGRPASHTSSEQSVVVIGWISLVAWVVYSLFRVFW